MTFSNADLLPRRLSPEGCRTATTQLLAAIAQLTSEHTTIPAPVAQAAEQVKSASTDLQAQGPQVPMNRLDNVADSCIAGISAVLDGHEQALVGDEIVALTTAQQKLLQTVRALRAHVLPDGTGFLHSRYRVQWERMSTLVNAFSQDDVKPTVESLGLLPAVQRLRGLTEQYGARLGITRVDSVDPDLAAQQLDRWHDAMGDLVLHVRQAFHDGANDRHASARRLLLAPYEQQAAADRSANASRKSRASKSSPGADT